MIKKRRTRYLIALVLLWSFGVTMMRGQRRPNDWVEAHWLISYQFGLIKRGLPGTLLKPLISLAPTQAESIITTASFVITALFSIALLALCWSILQRSAFSTTAVLIVAVFLTSPFIVMSGHLNGYSDGQIMLLSIVATALVLRGRMWAAALALTIGLFIHETIFFIGFPAVLWAGLMVTGFKKTQIVWKQLTPFLLPLVAFIALFLYQSFAVDAGSLESALVTYLKTFPFIRYDQEVIVPRSFAKSFVAQFQSQSPRVWGRLFDPYLMMTILPVTIALGLFTHAALREGNASRRLRVVGILLPFLPLILHLIAWDTPRIWTYPIFVALLTAWVACRLADPHKLADLNHRPLNIACLLILPLNILGRIPLMDWRVERFSILWRVILYSPLAVAVFQAVANQPHSDYTQADNHIVE